MALSRGLLQSLGFLGSIFLIMSFYRWNMFERKRAERMHNLQEVRKQLLKENCKYDKEATSEGKQSFEDISDSEMKHLIVDDKHGIIYCYIPKVACTNWKRVMFVLKQGEPYQDPSPISRDLAHVPGGFTLLNSFPRIEIKARLKHYTKFLFVRDPFVRLTSAYRDKFEKGSNIYFDNFTREILRLYGNQPNPPQTMAEASASGGHISFYNFIQYLLDPQTERELPFEPHWRQMHRLCHPCLIQYDFIGHQETLQEDAEQLLNTLKLQNDIKFPPSYDNITAPESLSGWFRTVPLVERRKLYKLYETDFRLFGYRKPDELLDG
ncbi:carbohydrate sulfotransferase 12-like isoform X2 [Hippoglossus hippoglossus]|uniref:carbohydrate sulfotransferase 12-like isoform X1 n=1 Tax=Hippoglossus hippoglossus TaxID=8267 RepID=UPI00148BBF93|nr:carbohydrate sulfotransferase 12-like isoform X1 [Hippoglossus hippoglossus]XP_034424544.1 carbohydrate sulfotransferase 12-like isoform X2 [Hippoglossus hippoglossus]